MRDFDDSETDDNMFLLG